VLLHLIRHGQSEGNLGSHASDPDLTSLGRQQATLVGERLEGNGIDLLLCSPLRRALRTAEIIGGKIKLKPVAWPDLMESWDGSDATPRSKLTAMFPNCDLDIPERWWPGPEGEEELYARASRLEGRIRALGEGTERRIAAVSHGTFGAVLISTFLGAPPCGYTRFSQHNCCVSILDLRPSRAKLYRGNDVSHLSAELLT
jgi:broad specificity phosphatase PhoE